MKNEFALKQRIAELDKLLAQKDAQIAALEERWRLAQQKQFGKSAEGCVGDGELFNEVEEIVEAVKAEQQSAKAPRKKPVRKPLPKDLRESKLFTISTVKPVIAVAVSYIKWVRISQKSLSLSLLKSKLLRISVLNTPASL